ncbi:MAG TPA: ATP synthase F1 subunit gamma [Bacteroidales bacterium]
MGSLKEIRTRIASVTSTRQITSAMKMVSAAKLKKAQDTILMMRPYANKLQEILSTLSSNDDGNDNPYVRERFAEKILIVVITSNRGLCGAFNANVIKLALQIAGEKYGRQLEEGKVRFMPIGRKASDFFSKKNYAVVTDNYNHLLDHGTFEKTAPAAQMMMNGFLDGTYDRIEIVYNQFKNAGVQITTNEQFLPIPKLPKEKAAKGELKPVRNDFIFEPSKELIIRELIPNSLRTQLHKALLDSIASEHGARMTAMHKATDNASELIKDLRLQYNKARQASITNEILEIVAGAEALQG